jgi:hypothetical protein
MSSVLGSVYRCPGCGHQEVNPHGYPMCPQCASDWQPVNKTEVSSDIAMASTTASTSSPVNSGSMGDLSPKRTSPSFEAVSTQRSTPVLTDDVATSENLSTPTPLPFDLSVRHDQQHATAATICLEIRIQNKTAQLQCAQIWLADRHGHEGPPQAFELQATKPASSISEQSLTVISYIDEPISGSSHIAVRIKTRSSRVAFWQGDLLVRRQMDGSISVTIDKSVRAETALGGIEGAINVYAGQMHDGEWQPLPARLRGPKDLAHPDDVRRPASPGLDRHIALRDGFPAAPPRGVARLTLSRQLNCGRQEYVNLLAGQTFHLGRARTWDSRQHADFVPNDIVLRSIATEEADDYISRYHGRIHILPHDVRYENLSGSGTHMGNSIHGAVRTLSEQGASLRLSSNTKIQPGRSVATDPNKSLELLVRRTSPQLDTEDYELLARDWHLQSSVDSVKIGDTVTLNRTDGLGELEHYVLFPQSTLIGSSETLCGWHLPDSSVQSVHAILLWFDGSFWIEPYLHDGEVRVNGVRILKNRVRRLTALASVKIGDLQFMVLPEWKQHIIDCSCCTGHG